MGALKGCTGSSCPEELEIGLLELWWKHTDPAAIPVLPAALHQRLLCNTVRGAGAGAAPPPAAGLAAPVLPRAKTAGQRLILVENKTFP